MRFSLRTLLFVMLLGGPALAGAWWIAADGIQRVKRGDAKPLHAAAAIGFVALAVALMMSQRKPRDN